jgi:hypothetical protein
MIGFGNAQEWFTSLEVAQRLALVQNKMLFVIWEGDLETIYPVILNDEKGNVFFANIIENEFVSKLIWENFVPVRLPEYKYAELSKDVKEKRGFNYYNKLIDDSIKIMDANGTIVNTMDKEKYFFIDEGYYLDISDFIGRYALNTSFLNVELQNYSKNKNFNTAFFLASKYLDYAILTQKTLRTEIIALANIYFDEAKNVLTESNIENKPALLQKLDLLQIKENLILNQAKKARRQIKKIEVEQIDSMNKSLFAFLNYTTFKLLKDDEHAELWKSDISSLDLKYAQLIVNNNLTAFGNTD